MLEFRNDEDGGDDGEDENWSLDLSGTPQLPFQSESAVIDQPPPFSDQVLENVLENVLCFLTSRRDRNSASLVCKSWFNAEAQSRLELFIGNCYAISPARAIVRFPCIRSLILKGKPRFADFNMVPYGWGASFSPWVSAMAPAYPWLERICLKRMTVMDADLKLLACSFPSFRDLCLICCDGFTTAGLAAVAENCRFLS